jgi:predicted transcriptional regulator
MLVEQTMTQIFLSHSGRNEQRMRNLKHRLETVGFKVWVYQDSLPGGRIRSRYLEEIRHSDFFIVLLSVQSLLSDDVLQELKEAIEFGTEKWGDFTHFLHLISLENHREVEKLLAQKMPQLSSLERIPYEKRDKIDAMIKNLASYAQITLNNQPNAPVGSWKTFPCSNFATMHPDSPLYCIQPSKTVGEALWIMRAKRIRHLPVTENGEPGSPLVGMISERDVAKFLSADTENANRVLNDGVMTDHVVVRLKPDDSIEEAIRLLSTQISDPYEPMHRHFVSAIPIVDNNNCAVGILSYINILNSMMRGELPVPNIKVQDCMTPFDKLDVALQGDRMASIYASYVVAKGTRTIPVINNRRDRMVLGMISDRNIFRTMQDTTSPDNMPVEHKDVMIEADNMDLILPSSLLADVIHHYRRSPRPDGLLAIDTPNSRRLLGVMEYVNLFKKLL